MKPNPRICAIFMGKSSHVNYNVINTSLGHKPSRRDGVPSYPNVSTHKASRWDGGLNPVGDFVLFTSI